MICAMFTLLWRVLFDTPMAKALKLQNMIQCSFHWMVLLCTPVNGWGDLDVSYFQSQGIEVKSLEKYSLFGRVNALGIDSESGQWIAVADPDWEGSAHSVKPEAVKDEMEQ